nr:alpha/beta hydrolase [Marinicella sp. W31]MDC2878646.1 alpha/beta hydrolase [Marinicella sp. W31]
MMRAFDGVALRYALFACENARGTVVIAAGRSEFIEKYTETISDLHRAGYAAAITDLRGQGRSERRPQNDHAGHIDRFSHYRRDIVDFFESRVRPALPGPYFLLGHSLGGLIALSVAEEASDSFAGLVLTAPFVGLKHDRYPEWLIRVIARTASLTGFTRSRSAPCAPRRRVLRNSPIRPTGYAMTATCKRPKPIRRICSARQHSVGSQPALGK